jgi:hypothetical protein
VDLHNYYTLDLGFPTNIVLQHDTSRKDGEILSSRYFGYFDLEEADPGCFLGFDFDLNPFGFVADRYCSFFDCDLAHFYKTEAYDRVVDIEYTKIPMSDYPTRFEVEDRVVDF